MRRWAWSSVGLPGLLLGGCLGGDPCVDQTGYLEGCGDPPVDDGARPDTPDPADEDAAAHVWYTSAHPLGDEPVDVVVVAVAGAFPSDAVVQIGVPGREDPRDVALVDGGFVETVEASASDTIRVVVDGRLAVALELGAEAPPGAPEGDTGAPGAVEPPTVTDGAVEVGDGRIAGFAAPYLAWIPQRGRAVLVEPGQGSVRLPAAAGDDLCLAHVVDEHPRAGVPVCLPLD